VPACQTQTIIDLNNSEKIRIWSVDLVQSTYPSCLTHESRCLHPCHPLCALLLLQGLGMIFDFYQQRTKEDAAFVGGWASNFTYDFELLGATCGLELDYIPGTGVTTNVCTCACVCACAGACVLVCGCVVCGGG